MNSQIITYDRYGFIINGKREFLIGGEFHYFRVPAALWEDRLQKMKSIGANLISVYIAWNLHEPVEGQQRWSGDYDLDRFLTLCKKYDFFVLIKPGPYICAELDFGGHPDWLITRIARGEFRLRTLDEGYLKLCRYWYESCAKQIRKHLVTNDGSIIAAQIENEYDHLIEFGEESMTEHDAIAYFMYLKDVMNEIGIDVPKFANEAIFLRGRGIIDTRTFYPNIPGLWHSEYERFEQKILSSKTSQPNSPIMIMETQAGWFAQIGAPIYSVGLDVVEGVSKSAFIMGASIINYYMMVGGTSFPFMGARGDTMLGGHGIVTSYDFGGAPVGETGELHPEKYHWLKGFIRFAKEFNHIIAKSDGQRYVISGCENIAVLGKNDAVLDTIIDNSYEKITTYEEGCRDGRFFFVRNCDEEPKVLTVHLPETLAGIDQTIRVNIAPKETLIFPLDLAVPGSSVRINHSTSEVLLSKTFGLNIAFVLCGKTGTSGNLALDVAMEEVTVLHGSVKLCGSAGGCMLAYEHRGIIIAQARNTTFFIVEDTYIGRIEELNGGLLFHNCYWLKSFEQHNGVLSLTLQIKEHTENVVMYFPMIDEIGFQTAKLDGRVIALQRDSSGMQSANFSVDAFLERPKVRWVSDWKYMDDSAEVDPAYDHSMWRVLDKPISLEEAGIFEHGYYWYRTQFELPNLPEHIYLDFKHNGTDRYLLYLNGSLVFRTRNESMSRQEITGLVKTGCNTLVVLYANEFHNKSHPHEGAIVKLSGIMQPIMLSGEYFDGAKLDMALGTFYVKRGLQGMADGFTRADFDDTAWRTAPDVDKFVVDREMGHIVWFRRYFRYNTKQAFSAPLKFVPRKAIERLTVYVNGRSVARYDVIGPQEEFFIPDAYINPNDDNVLVIILECLGSYKENLIEFQRGYMYNPELEPSYVAKMMRVVLE